MTRKILAGLLLLFFSAPAAQAQGTTISGQILMPDGSPVSRSLQFHLSSNDGRINEFHYTDSYGRFTIDPGRSMVMLYTITVEGDGRTFATTQFSFGRDWGQVRMVLNPVKPRPDNRAPTTSAASVYRPKPEARKLHKKALQELEEGKLESAEASLRRAIARDPQFTDAFNDLGVLLARRERYAESEEILRRGLQTDPKSPRILANLGQALNHLRRHSEAIPYLRESLRLDPGWHSTGLHLGIALIETQQLAEAEPVLKRASEFEGSIGQAALLYLGQLYARTGEFPKGIAALETYLQKSPEGANAGAARELLERMKREMAARP
jgi:Tfp pilus assembly protein PilF